MKNPYRLFQRGASAPGADELAITVNGKTYHSIRRFSVHQADVVAGSVFPIIGEFYGGAAIVGLMRRNLQLQQYGFGEEPGDNRGRNRPQDDVISKRIIGPQALKQI